MKITVEDNGIGIEKNDSKTYFRTVLQRKKVVDEQISGNGLGLSLVKQIVSARRKDRS